MVFQLLQWKVWNWGCTKIGTSYSVWFRFLREASGNRVNLSVNMINERLCLLHRTVQNHTQKFAMVCNHIYHSVFYFCTKKGRRVNFMLKIAYNLFLINSKTTYGNTHEFKDSPEMYNYWSSINTEKTHKIIFHCRISVESCKLQWSCMQNL